MSDGKVMHRVVVSDAASERRDFIGGAPLLQADEAAACRLCGRGLVPFLQLDLRGEFGLPFKAGSHLVVMMCPLHNEIPDSDLASPSELPPAYWELGSGHYLLRLYPPSVALVSGPVDRHLRAAGLSFEPEAETIRAVGGFLIGSEGFKIGGTPSWAQVPECHVCCCGAEMAFIGQVPLDHPFPKLPEAPEQPDTFSSDDYCLFLGNETYLFACPRQCHPGAVWPVLQN